MPTHYIASDLTVKTTAIMFELFMERSVSIIHLLTNSLSPPKEEFSVFEYRLTQTYPEYSPGLLILRYGSSTFETDSVDREITRLSAIALSLFDASASGVLVRWVTGNIGKESLVKMNSPFFWGIQCFPDGGIRFGSASDLIQFIRTFIAPPPSEAPQSQWVLTPALDAWVDKSTKEIRQYPLGTEPIAKEIPLVDEIIKIVSDVTIS